MMLANGDAFIGALDLMRLILVSYKELNFYVNRFSMKNIVEQ